MTDVYLYIVAASKDPNNITCKVPYLIDKNEIFFGPCKRNLRQLLRLTYLKSAKKNAKVNKPIFLVGVNGGNSEKIRKIVWAGKIKNIMTFAHAYRTLTSKRYNKMRNDELSPLLTTPIYKHGNLCGYKHRKNLHKFNDNWVNDLSDKRSVKHLQKIDDKLILKRKAAYAQTFTRDCCIVLKNIFFANKSGIEFDKKALKILTNVQPNRDIDSYAIFGYSKNGSAYGRTGSYLHFAGTNGQDFMRWLIGKASELKLKGGSQNAPTHTLC